MQYSQFYAVNHTTGVSLPYATATVRIARTATLAALFDEDGDPIANPTQASAAGLLSFAVADGSYDITIESGSYSAPPIENLTIVDVLALKAEVLGANSVVVSEYGAVVDDDTFDNTDAINSAEAAAELTDATVLFADGGTYYYQGTLTAARNGLAWLGRNTRLIYNGVETDRNLLELGDGVSDYSRAVISGIEIGSETVMTAGAAILARRMTQSLFEIAGQGEDLNADLGNTLWNGFVFQGYDNVTVNAEGWSAQNDVAQVSGVIGAGPKDRLFWNVGKTFEGAVGMRIGGAAGAVSLGTSNFVGNGTNVLIDQTLIAEVNRDVLIQNAVLQSAGTDGLVINDAGAVRVLVGGACIRSSGRRGVWVQNCGGNVVMGGGYMIFDNAEDGVRVDDADANVLLGSGLVYSNGAASGTAWGINPNVASNKVVLAGVQVITNGLGGARNVNPANTPLGVTGASTLGFNQGGTGARMETVEEALRRGAVTPEEYGAVGDGTTNDYAALQAALNTGRQVYRSPGKVYAHTTALSITTSHQRFCGPGRLRPIGSIDGVVLSGGCVGVVLDLTFDAPGHTGGSLLKINNASRVVLERLNILDGYGGLWVQQANVVTVEWMWGGGCRGPAIKLYGTTGIRTDVVTFNYASVRSLVGAGFYGFDMDGDVHTVSINYLGIVCGTGVSASNGKGFITRNTTGGPDPAIVQLLNAEVDYAGGHAFELAAGSDFDLVGCYALGASSSGLKNAATINDYEVRISGGKYRGNGTYGIENAGGVILYSGNADLSSNGTAATLGNVWTSTPRVQFGPNHYITNSGANPLWGWDTNDYQAYDTSGNSLNTVIGGVNISALSATGLALTTNTMSFSLGASSDVVLNRDAADVLAQYRGTTAQTFRLYGTRTDGSNYGRLGFTLSGSTWNIQTEAAGTGSATSLALLSGGNITFGSAGSAGQWRISSGHFVAVTDNTVDIGASGVNRPRNGYFANNVVATARFQTGGDGKIDWSSRTAMTSPSDGVLLLSNASVTDFSRLQFGGTSASFPAWKRTGSGLDARLADDSAYTSVRASLFWFTNGSYINDLADGVISLRNGTGNDFNRLTFGGSSSSFPALKRSGTTLAARLADDSADAPFTAASFSVTATSSMGGASLIGIGNLTFGVSNDLTLSRDTANILAQRNGTAAQFFRVYNTYTDSSNSERLAIGWNVNTCFISTENAGTGVTRPLVIRGGNGLSLSGNSSTSEQWAVLSSGHLRPNPDNTYDLGTSGVRVRNIYVGTAVFANSLSITSAAGTNRANIISPSDGVIGFYNAANTDFSRLQFGGTTSSFPSLKRSTTEVHVRLADDSTFGTLVSGGLFVRFGYIGLGASDDVVLNRDGAADILALYRAANAQAFRVYNTRTDASNYERLGVFFTGNIAVIRTQQAGTGAPRDLYIGTEGSAQLSLLTANTKRWNVNASGHFLAEADNTYDIGASGANRPRNVNVAGFLVAGGSIEAGLSSRLGFNGRGGLNGVADGVFSLTNNAGTGLSRLQFGGTTSAFPSWKRSGADMHLRLADDSDFANLVCNSATANTFIGTAGLFVDTYLSLNLAAGVSTLSYDNGDRRDFDRATNIETLYIGGVAKVNTSATKQELTVPLELPDYTVVQLNALTGLTAGMRAFCNDALTPTFGAAVVGGGAVFVPVYYTGSAWFVG